MSPSNVSAAAVEHQCIVNDQMVPFTVFYIFIFVISLPGNLLSAWAFICTPRAEVGQRGQGVSVRGE